MTAIETNPEKVSQQMQQRGDTGCGYRIRQCTAMPYKAKGEEPNRRNWLKTCKPVVNAALGERVGGGCIRPVYPWLTPQALLINCSCAGLQSLHGG